MNLNYYQAGCKAHRDGRSMFDHGYSPGSHAQKQWVQGWKNEQWIRAQEGNGHAKHYGN
jgi:hypothetical protein